MHVAFNWSQKSPEAGGHIVNPCKRDMLWSRHRAIITSQLALAPASRETGCQMAAIASENLLAGDLEKRS